MVKKRPPEEREYRAKMDSFAQNRYRPVNSVTACYIDSLVGRRHGFQVFHGHVFLVPQWLAVTCLSLAPKDMKDTVWIVGNNNEGPRMLGFASEAPMNIFYVFAWATS